MAFQKNSRLKDFAYYKTGGTCELLSVAESETELREHMREIKRRGLRLQLLGGGTNSLVMDEHFPGAFVVFSGLKRLERHGDLLIVGAGVENSLIPKLALGAGLVGASWMYRLPGQLGGTTRMNARCYGGEISQIVKKVRTVTLGGEAREYTDPAMFRGYKDTIFMDNGELISEVEIKLAPGNAKEIEEKMLFCEADREGKGQFDYPSCGCVFKNDHAVGITSGILLDQVGAKQLKHQGAEVSPHHANFVYNKGATSRAILELSVQMRQLVYDRFGIWMEYEMEILGEAPADLAAEIALERPGRWTEPKYAELLMPLRAKMVGKT